MKEVKCACFGLDLYQFILLTVILSSWLHWTPKTFGSGDNSIKALSTTCQMLGILLQFSRSVMFNSVIPWIATHQASLSIINSRSSLKLMSIESVMPSNHPLSSPSPPTFNHSQHQGLFKWVSSSHEVAKGLEFQLQHQSFQWTHRTDLL